jgi:uncharacterized protein
MKIVFDENKRILNLQKHGLDFCDVEVEFFEHALITNAKDGRLLAVGFLVADLIATIFVRLGSQGLSIISMRSASRKERKAYELFQTPRSPHH